MPIPNDMKRVLMVAYHFPPLAGSSGIQRTLRFVQQLPDFGWQTLVLSAHPRAYERTSSDLNSSIPEGTVVRRAFALDTARHLAIAGRYVHAMARPDRWVNWKIAAVREGMRMIREFNPDVIWSTYPIATAHLIGAELARRSGVAWVADFRDPMAQVGYPSDPLTWQCFKDIEQDAVSHAAACVFTSSGAARMYRERYPEAAGRIKVIENGYDEESFIEVERGASSRQCLNSDCVTLLHSGIVYPHERDPEQLFIALGRLKAAGKIQPGQLKLRFRAPEHVHLLQQLAIRYRVEPFIEICAPVAYQDALHEMLCSDALLVMQGAGCNQQIPAKIYEYLRARRPILCLSDASGDTARLLRQAGMDAIADLDSADQIEAILPLFIESVRCGTAALPCRDVVHGAARHRRTQALAQLMNGLSTSALSFSKKMR
jgi:hypothetical protein